MISHNRKGLRVLSKNRNRKWRQALRQFETGGRLVAVAEINGNRQVVSVSGAPNTKRGKRFGLEQQRVK